MDEELDKNEINTAETEGLVPEVAGDETEVPAEVTTEETTPNAEWAEIMNQYAPGTDTTNPQAILDAYLPIAQKQIAMEQKIKDACESSPETAAFMSDVIDTGNVIKSLNRNFSPEELQALLDESGDDEFEEDRTAFSGKVKEGKDRADYLKGNQDVSIAEISAWYEEKGWPEEKADEFSQKVDAFATDLFDGKITKEHLSQLEKAFNYDGDLTTAEENGKIIGKNEKITSGKKTRDDLKDLLPEGGGSASSKVTPKPTYTESYNTASPLKKLNI
jgi:hypothetical protein